MKRFCAIGIGAVAGMLILAGGTLLAQNLCERVDMKPVLTLEQVQQNELVEFMTELLGLKQRPDWPTDVSGMTPEEYYQMEVKMLVDNGLPPMFLEIEPDRIVNRRYFASLMFQIALQVDENVQADCANAVTETDQLQCLVDHDYIYSAEGKIYRDEILSVLCNKQDIIAQIVAPPPPMLAPAVIVPEVFGEAVLEVPGSLI